ncbi:MAG: putative toxin-antitoxin system toxin component, PIN family [Desulfamplus sp.]|nr:putative toxin-antitoxin system toxin component, PIN family [Desulfamplus sp.]
MKKYRIVIDTNVFISALRSKRGASYKLLSMIDSGNFETAISVPLILEYEDVAKRQTHTLGLSPADIDDILDYICQIGNKREIFYLWRPILKDPKDDMVLELAVESESDYILTYNKKDFLQSISFGIEILTPKEFLEILGEL